jgi:hypothetical protein
MRETILLTFAIERRSVTVCRFRGVVLEFAKKRDLSSQKDKAEGTADTFVRWACEVFSPERVAVEIDPEQSSRRRDLQTIVERIAKERALPLWCVPKDGLFSAYGEPPLKSRAELRRVASGLWPILAGKDLGRGALDAAALGLFVQCQAALNEIEEEGRHARAS